MTSLLGDPAVDTSYVLTSGNRARIEQIISEVATSDGLRRFVLRKPLPWAPHYPYIEYTTWAPGGGVSIYLTFDPRPPFLLAIDERYTAHRSAQHRKLARDLEARFEAAGIVFHRGSDNELVRLKDERFKKEN